MPVWATYDDYIETYRRGSPGAIPEELFAFWEGRAEESVNFKRVEVEDPPPHLIKCVCEVAEILFEADQAPKPGELVSESNASYSWKAREGRPAGEVRRDIREAVVKHLAGSELHDVFVFRAV